MKKMFLLLVIISTLAFASAIQYTPVTDTIIPELYGQQARFNLVGDGISGDYQIYTLTDVSLSPKGSFYITPGMPFEVTVYPTPNLKEKGYYSFTYYLKKDKGESIEDKIIVNIVPLSNSLELVSDYIDPSNQKATFFIKSKVNLELNQIKARFSSPVFDEEQFFNVSPFGTTEINIDVDQEKMKLIEAGSYLFTMEVASDKGPVKFEGAMLLSEKRSITTDEKSEGFLIHKDTITKSNTGNVATITQVTIKKNLISRLFTTFNVAPTIVERDGLSIEYTWNRKLDPTMSFKVISKTNWVFPFLLAIFATLLVLGFVRYSNSKVEVSKSVSYVKAKGGEFALKVKLKVKSHHAIQNASVIDKIPGILQLYEKTINATKVDSLNRRITWNLGNMAAGEERELSYVVFSRVGVVGRFSLPKALAVFEQNGKIHEVDSNEVFFLSEQINTDDF